MYELLPMEIAASAMRGNQVRLGVISSNLANARTTRRPDGEGPYQRRTVVFQAELPESFQQVLDKNKETGAKTIQNTLATGAAAKSSAGQNDGVKSSWLLEEHLRGVATPEVKTSDKTRTEYDPQHPDADPVTGLVTYPDINVMTEMTDMISASRDYEANLGVMRNTRDMMYQLIDLLRT